VGNQNRRPGPNARIRDRRRLAAAMSTSSSRASEDLNLLFLTMSERAFTLTVMTRAVDRSRTVGTGEREFHIRQSFLRSSIGFFMYCILSLINMNMVRSFALSLFLSICAAVLLTAELPKARRLTLVQKPPPPRLQQGATIGMRPITRAHEKCKRWNTPAYVIPILADSSNANEIMPRLLRLRHGGNNNDRNTISRPHSILPPSPRRWRVLLGTVSQAIASLASLT
jgi:hypothetical protein